MEMTMSVRDGERTEHCATTAAVGVAYWATEFERVYVMTAARIRGKPRMMRQPLQARHQDESLRLVYPTDNISIEESSDQSTIIVTLATPEDSKCRLVSLDNR
jgi:hypothetical protein